VTVVVSEQAADAVADKTSAKCRRRSDSDPSLVLSPTASFWRRPPMPALRTTFDYRTLAQANFVPGCCLSRRIALRFHGGPSRVASEPSL
jgi:hypothetical protein